MGVKQISVFIENKNGKLAEVTRYIADHNINLRALSIADTVDFGILRLICEDTEYAAKILNDGGYITKVNHVLATALPDKPGSLAFVLEILAKEDIEVEYTYAFLSHKKDAYMIFRVNDNKKATSVLEAAGINVISEKDLF